MRGSLAGSGSGTATPGLPVWTYTAGAMAAGKLKTDNAAPASTASIQLSVTPKTGATMAAFFATFNTNPRAAFLVLTGSDGAPNTFAVSAVTNNTTYYTFTLTWLSGTTAWSGDYQVAFSTMAEFVTSANTQSGAVTIDMASVQTASSITPIADGTVAPVTSITTVKGIVTAAS